MSDDARQVYEKLAKSVADQLKKDGHRIEIFTDDEGNSISGWRFRRRSMPPEHGYLSPSGGWREVWGERLDIFTEDGDLYEYENYNKDERISNVTPIKETRSKSFRKWPLPYLVGNEGMPFSKISAQLERFRWTCQPS